MFWEDYDSSTSLRHVVVGSSFESWSSEGKSGGKGCKSGASSEVSGAVFLIASCGSSDFCAFAGIITRVGCPVADCVAVAVFVDLLIVGRVLVSPSGGCLLDGKGCILPLSASGRVGCVSHGIGRGGGCNSGEGECFEAHFHNNFLLMII